MKFKRQSVLLALLLVSSLVYAQVAHYYGVAFSRASRTAAQYNSSDIANQQWKGAYVIIATTAYTSGNYTFKVQGKDSLSGSYYDIVAGSAISGAGTQVLKIYPGITAATSASVASVSDMLPAVWRVQANGAGGPSATWSVSFVME